MKILATFLLATIVTGCGQSGPLYIPGDPSRMAVPPENPENVQQTDEDEPEEDKPATDEG